MIDKDPDGIMEIVQYGNTSIVEYYIEKGVPMAAGIRITNDEIGISMIEGAGVGINHKSNVPVKVLGVVQNNAGGNILDVRTKDQDITDDLSDSKWDVEQVESFESDI